MKFLIAGLGNVGAKYENTRHNIGFMAADYMAKAFDKPFEPERYALKTEVGHKGRKIHIIKPTTLMNESGKAVHYWMEKLKVPLERCMIITDDVALDLGVTRLKAKGSDGGHNGLKDIQEKTGTSKFPRLRLGIGKDYPKGKQIEYVLGDFSDQEMKEVKKISEKVKNMMLCFCTEGIDRTMNKYNN